MPLYDKKKEGVQSVTPDMSEIFGLGSNPAKDAQNAKDPKSTAKALKNYVDMAKKAGPALDKAIKTHLPGQHGDELSTNLGAAHNFIDKLDKGVKRVEPQLGQMQQTHKDQNPGMLGKIFGKKPVDKSKDPAWMKGFNGGPDPETGKNPGKVNGITIPKSQDQPTDDVKSAINQLGLPGRKPFDSDNIPDLGAPDKDPLKGPYPVLDKDDELYGAKKPAKILPAPKIPKPKPSYAEVPPSDKEMPKLPDSSAWNPPGLQDLGVKQQKAKKIQGPKSAQDAEKAGEVDKQPELNKADPELNKADPELNKAVKSANQTIKNADKGLDRFNNLKAKG